jgi:hypothetical protein
MKNNWISIANNNSDNSTDKSLVRVDYLELPSY